MDEPVILNLDLLSNEFVFSSKQQSVFDLYKKLGEHLNIIVTILTVEQTINPCQVRRLQVFITY